MTIRLLAVLLLWFGHQGGPPRQVEVLVLDETRAPIVGAVASTFEASPAHRALTDQAGSCTLPIVVGASPFRLRVEKEGYFHLDSTWFAQQQITVALKRAVTLVGQVRALEGGAPIPAAELRLVHPGCKHCEPTSVRADAEGRYEFATVPRGIALELHVGAADFPRQSLVLGALSETDSAHRDVDLERGRIVRGRVVDLQSGDPLVGARITTLPGRLNQTLSRDDGTFELHAVAESFRQMIRLEAQTDGRCKLGLVLVPNELRDDFELRLPLPRFCAVEGIVLDAASTPLAGAEVFLREDVQWLAKRRARGVSDPRTPLDDLPATWTVSSGTPNASTTSDAEGRFRFEHVTPWMTEFLVHSRHASGSTAQRMLDAAGAPGTTLKVDLRPESAPPAARVFGTVKLNGAAVQGVLEWRGTTRSGKVSIDPRGVFDAHDVEVGDIELAVHSLHTQRLQLGSNFLSERVRVTTSLDEPLQHSFELTCALEKIRGRITDLRGTPRAKIPVAAIEPLSNARSQAQTDDAGRFELDVLSGPNPWRVMVINGPQTFEHEGARVGGPDVEFKLPELARLRVRLVDAKTRANLAPAQVIWRFAGAGGLESRSPTLEPVRDDPSWWSVELPTGELEIGAWVARASYPPTAPIPINLGATSPATLEFTLVEGRALDIVLAADSARPPRELSARIWIVESVWWAQRDPALSTDVSRNNVNLASLAERFRVLQFDDTGRAHVPGLAPGRYRFVTATPGDSVQPAEIEIVESEQAPIEIRWRRDP